MKDIVQSKNKTPTSCRHQMFYGEEGIMDYRRLTMSIYEITCKLLHIKETTKQI